MIKNSRHKTLIASMLVVVSFSLLSFVIAQPVQISDKQQQLADELFDYSGYYAKRFIVEKLMKLNLPDKCWEKALGNNGWGAHKMSFVTGDVAAWFKEYLKDDDVFAYGSSLPEQKDNRPRIEKAVEGMKAKYFLTVDASECDCNQTTSDLVSKYISYVGSYPYRQGFVSKSGVYFARLVITPKVKDVTATVSKDGREFSVTAPAEIEPAAWDSKIDKVFSKAHKDY
ncbi:MAG: hypothetical protein AB1489_17655 [Acidobacteriota bacterium]